MPAVRATPANVADGDKVRVGAVSPSMPADARDPGATSPTATRSASAR